MDTSETYIKIKTCSKCGLEKHLYDFSVDHSVKSGRRSYCKRCQSLYNITHPHYNDPRIRKEYDERYQVKEDYKIKHREDARNHRLKYPEKTRARLAGQVLQKEPCEVCGNPIAEAHHDDYSKPWEVRWLCKKHHEEVESGYKSRVYIAV